MYVLVSSICHIFSFDSLHTDDISSSRLREHYFKWIRQSAVQLSLCLGTFRLGQLVPGHFVLILYCIVFIHFYSASHGMSLSKLLPTITIDTVSEFTRYRQLQVKDFCIPKVAIRAWFEPATLRSKGIDSVCYDINFAYCCNLLVSGEL